MKYLFTEKYKVLDKIRQSPKVLLLLDYDGTLTPIVKRPELAQLGPSCWKLLQNLRKKLILGIISGRSLRDIKDLVKISGIIYAGNHGLEIEFSGKVYAHPSVRGFSRVLDRIARELRQNLKHIQGIIVEHKGLTLGLHYRCVNRLRQAEVKRIFNNVVNPLVRTRKVKVTKGKKVFEVRPSGEWNKGRAVTKIIQKIKRRVLPVYIGDDITDEDAFKVIRNKGITIYVGRPKKSYAHYFVWNVDGTLKFLRKTYEACKRTI